MRTATGGACDLKSESLSESDRSDSKSDNTMHNVICCNNGEWVINGHKRNRFSPKYDAGIKGKLMEKKNPEKIYEDFLDDKICELTAQQTNIYTTKDK
jgi:hypothetical protein